MIPGQRYDHDPRHWRFPRTLDDHTGLDRGHHAPTRYRPARDSVLVLVAIAVALAALLLTGR
jgi:hypothetical protein